MDLKMNYLKEKKNIKMSEKDKIITLTYGDCAENHVGMQQLGEKEDRGFSLDELKKLCVKMKKDGANCEIIIFFEKIYSKPKSVYDLQIGKQEKIKMAYFFRKSDFKV